MNKLILALASLTLFSTAAYGQIQVLPNLYADRYCALRRLGVSEDDAIKAAVYYAHIQGTTPTVKYKGSSINADAVIAVETAYRKCPQFFGAI